jgi:hypothetical protein
MNTIFVGFDVLHEAMRDLVRARATVVRIYGLSNRITPGLTHF